MTTHCCRTCQHVRLTVQCGDLHLFCHRNPPDFFPMPVVNPDRSGGLPFAQSAVWPPVGEDEDCGEYRPDPAAIEDPTMNRIPPPPTAPVVAIAHELPRQSTPRGFRKR